MKRHDRNKVITLINVDVTKTYNYVLHIKLLYNVKKMLNSRIQRIKSFLKERRLLIIFEKK